MEDQEPWLITILRANGLGLMRPEKSWRPIISIDIDGHSSHDTVLGTDGQNPNLKEVIQLHQVRAESQVDIKVWYRSPSKKKKKRTLVASASCSLGELMKRHDAGSSELDSAHTRKRTGESDQGTELLEIRLQCQNTNTRAVASRGRPQNGAFLVLKVRQPPITWRPQSTESHPASEPESVSSSSDAESDTLSPSPRTPRTQSPIRRVRIKGYVVDSGEESSEGLSDDEKQPLIRHPHHHHHSPHSYDLDDDDDDGDKQLQINICEDDDGHHRPIAIISLPQRILSSLLPQYTERLVLPPTLTGWRWALASFTLYGELQAACTHTQFEECHKRLQSEWQYSGAILLALTGVDVAILAISTDTIFPVTEAAKRAASASVMASILGLFYTVFFFIRYNWIDPDTFADRAKDIYGSYASFALSARLPGLCLLLSVLSLLAFVFLVTYEAWSQGVLALCFFVGLITTIQFLIYSTHWLAGKVAAGGRAGTRGVINVVTRIRTASTGTVSVDTPRSNR